MFIGWAILIQVVVFVVVIVVLRRLLHSHTYGAVNRLKKIEGESKRKEKELEKKTKEVEEEYQEKIKAAKEDIKKLNQEAQELRENSKQEALAKVRQEADGIIKAAHTSRERIRQEIIQGLEKTIIEFSCQLVKHVFTSDHLAVLGEKFIEEVILELEGADTAYIPFQVEEAEIIFNYPPTLQQKERIGQVLSRKVSPKIKLKEKKDEKIVAGIIIRLGTFTIDGSLRSRLEEEAQALKDVYHLRD
ncbi:MAG: F0F1 ATP synthase subunit delta [Candidatus Omnitrophota bacterium]